MSQPTPLQDPAAGARRARGRILVFDFDGVIADSSREGFVTALRTHAALAPGSPVARVREALEPVLAAGAAAVDVHPWYRPFMSLMPLGNRAEDFGVALEAVAAGLAIADQESYDAFYALFDKRWRRTFHERFYVERAAFAAAAPALWRALQPPYREVVEILRGRKDAVTLALATAKDRSSVETLLAEYSLAGVFPPELVLDKEAGVSKVQHLERLSRLLGAGFAEMTFIDDKLRHLESVAGLGVRCVLAAWGYNGERERAAARACGFDVYRPGDLEGGLFSEPVKKPLQ